MLFFKLLHLQAVFLKLWTCSSLRAVSSPAPAGTRCDLIFPSVCRNSIWWMLGELQPNTILLRSLLIGYWQMSAIFRPLYKVWHGEGAQCDKPV